MGRRKNRKSRTKATIGVIVLQKRVPLGWTRATMPLWKKDVRPGSCYIGHQRLQKVGSGIVSKDMKKILITGGSGLIGRAVTSQLQKQGYEVAWLSRKPKKQQKVF